MRALTDAAVAAASADRAPAFLDAAARFGRALAALGRDADAPIVIAEALPLVSAAEQEGAVFLPSGAGGGDVFVRLGSAPSGRFDAAARASGFERLDLRLDVLGVRILRG
jgi:phosphomevalonate kinase